MKEFCNLAEVFYSNHLLNMRKIQKRNLPRIILQWSVISYLLYLAARSYFNKSYTPDFEAYCPFGGIQALSSYFLSNSLACTMTTSQIAMGIMLIIGIFLFSKLFCAFICPVGTISEWLGKAGDKYKLSRKLSRLTDKILRSLKYVLLFITVYYTLSSNELFCKKFDPYFAVASGFNSDVVWWYAAITLLLVVAGSLLVKLFWCKYICPLGAISNIIKFSWFFAALIITYILILLTGIQLSFVWPLAIACIGGYCIEIWGEKINFFPVAKITRNASTCTSCKLCSRKCPQLIDVAGMKVVKAADCNLCGDCLVVCPEKDTLQINKRSRLKWLPPFAVVVMILLGLILSSNWELPTISLRWGSKEEIQKAAVFTQTGLKEIKCFGSSTAFASKMKEVKGVLGVETFVSTHSVKVYYDSAILNDRLIQTEIFTPRKEIIHYPEKETDNVRMVSLLLDNFFDPSDFDNLTVLLKNKTDALGIESQFSCPVTVRIYLPDNSLLDESKLKEILEAKSIEITTDNESACLDLSFKVAGELNFSTIANKEFRIHMFQPDTRIFNWKTDYNPGVLDTLMVSVLNKYCNNDSLAYFVSHLSNDHGVVGLQSTIDSTSLIFFKIIYVDSLTNGGNVMKNIKNDSLTVNYEGGDTGKLANSFKF